MVLGCTATAKAAAKAGTIVGYVLTKGSAMSTYTTTVGSATAAMKLTPSGGTVLYDSVNGNYAGYDHILVSVILNRDPTFYANGYLSMYIPSIASTDAGSYYCTFIDGSYDPATATTLATSFANSGSYVLTVTTKSGSDSKSVSGSRSKALEYSLLLLGATKSLF